MIKKKTTYKQPVMCSMPVKLVSTINYTMQALLLIICDSM
jgi:hypothetical protein